VIDFHSHILPGIDDGSSSEELSCRILEELKNQGVTEVVFTPHYYGRRHSVEQFLFLRHDAFMRLSAQYTGGLITHLGCECNIAMCALNDLSELRAVAVEGTRYILTEMDFGPEWDGTLSDRVQSLLRLGLRPVIAHVEIYPAVRKHPSLAAELIARGCLLQINCDSIVDGDALAFALIEHGQIHALGSDTHNMTARPPKYAQAAKIFTSRYGVQAFEKIQKNMADMLANAEVSASVGAPVKRKLFGKYV